jgi:hypothetical protein
VNNIHVNFANVLWVAFSIPSGLLSLVKSAVYVLLSSFSFHFIFIFMTVNLTKPFSYCGLAATSHLFVTSHELKTFRNVSAGWHNSFEVIFLCHLSKGPNSKREAKYV